MPPTFTVVVPPGVSAGGLVEFEAEDGSVLQATVPEDCDAGDSFQVTVDEQGAVHHHALFAAEQSDGSVMGAFVEWFEREEVGQQIETWMAANAHRMGNVRDLSGEQSHEWWPLYLEYQQRFEALLSSFLDSAGCTSEQLMAEADAAEGMNDMYLRIFLAHSEYEQFVEQMGQEALKQAAAMD